MVIAAAPTSTWAPSGVERKSFSPSVSGPLVLRTHAPVRPTGNSRDAALRRLRKDRPGLHAGVIA
jgi:hypothetical protein